MPNHTFSEEIFPYIQHEPPLEQLETVSLCPATCYLGKLPPASFYVVDSDKVPLESLFLQAKKVSSSICYSS